MLQRRGMNAGCFQLPRSASGRREALNLISITLGCHTYQGQRSGFSGTGASLKARDLITTSEDVEGSTTLCCGQVTVEPPFSDFAQGLIPREGIVLISALLKAPQIGSLKIQHLLCRPGSARVIDSLRCDFYKFI